LKQINIRCAIPSNCFLSTGSTYFDIFTLKWSWLVSLTYYLHQMVEYQISIYGRKKSEWDQMASWIVNNELYSENVVGLIQVISYSLLCYWS
jgi:hypothetical protein